MSEDKGKEINKKDTVPQEIVVKSIDKNVFLC